MTVCLGWVESHKKLSKWQVGFRRRLGCNIQCLDLFQPSFSNFQKTKAPKNIKAEPLPVFKTDFQKAYDSVKHLLLGEKLVSAAKY